MSSETKSIFNSSQFFDLKTHPTINEQVLSVHLKVNY
jgi:hypothetical protein